MPNPKYTIYRYKIVRARQRQAFTPDGEATANEGEVRAVTAAERLHFADLFGAKKLNIFTTADNGDVTVHDNRILAVREGVVLMEFCNEKLVTICNDFQERQETSRPWSRVIIDCRQDGWLMAVERTGAFRTTDRVRDILAENFTRLLRDYHLAFTAQLQVLVDTFWKLVNKRRVEGDRVRHVTFWFKGRGKQETVDGMNERFKAMDALIRSINGYKGSLSVDVADVENSPLDKTNEDLAQMVTLALEDEYDLSVTFEKFGVWRSDREVLAYYELPERATKDFVEGMTTTSETGEHSYELVDWIEDVKLKISDYRDATPVKRKRKRRR